MHIKNDMLEGLQKEPHKIDDLLQKTISTYENMTNQN